MSLQRLSVSQFRNIHTADIELSPRVNLFYGPNGSGKTSILEAISLLSLGRSFRSRKTRTLINHQSDSFTIFGKLIDEAGVSVPVGVYKNMKGEVIIKKSGARCSSAVELAQLFPLRIINNQSFQFLEGSPQVRRQFLDWLVFHVEPEFIHTWRDYEKCLKQRNILIKHDKIDRLMLDTWEAKLSTCGNRLSDMRLATFDKLKSAFSSLTADLAGLAGVELKFTPGWDRTKPLADTFKDNRQRDTDLGYTLQGPHRADLKLQVGVNPASEFLSRGQQKLLICALYLAQGQVLGDLLGIKTTYLVDDLPAELDNGSRVKVANWLMDVGAQVFVTGIERQALEGLWPPEKGGDDNKVFHVKHGDISLCDIG